MGLFFVAKYDLLNLARFISQRTGVMKRIIFLTSSMLILIFACDLDQKDERDSLTIDETIEMPGTTQTFGGRLEINDPFNYADQAIPDYITKDNTTNNPIEDKTATLGRVLFYDKALSQDNSVSCASCHQQVNAFGDQAIVSEGLNGVTGRHSMRLINSRFSDEEQFFWDERAATLEEQSTMPIQDHVEMGFSGTEGDPNFSDLIEKLEAIDYYQELFTWAYGDMEITEARMQESLAQFIRSIQSFDSKYDLGRAQVDNEGQNFSNYSALENQGKRFFLDPPDRNGAGCAGCHRPPEFDIDPDSRSNGITSVANSATDIDIENTRAPSLRDLFNTAGNLNGPMMHDGSMLTMEEVIAHYSNVPGGNGIDRRVENQNLELNEQEVEALIAFLKTLSGSEVYMEEKWSDPFAE